MFSHNQDLYVQHQVGRSGKGRTAETCMVCASVQPPYLVRPIHTRTHRGADGRTRTRADISIYVRQGKEVGQIKGWCGFQPSDLSSNLLQPWTDEKLERCPIPVRVRWGVPAQGRMRTHAHPRTHPRPGHLPSTNTSAGCRCLIPCPIGFINRTLKEKRKEG